MFEFTCKIVLSFVLVFPAFSQQKSKQPQEPTIPADIQTILLEAGTLRPELTIDVYLKLVSSGKLKAKPSKNKCLKKHFIFHSIQKKKFPER